jgi:cell division protein FtsB
MISIAPRRVILVGATILLAWLIVSFGRQVAEASASSARAEELRAANAALAAEVAAMELELQVIQDQRYISQAARAFRLGASGEIPFALEADAPPLAPDAPGSAAARLGEETESMSPLERWLDLLFGPGD